MTLDGKSRALPKPKGKRKAKGGKSGLLRDWRKVSGVRRKFAALAERWKEERPDLAGGFEAVATAIAELDKLMATKPVKAPEAVPPAAAAASPRRRRIVHAAGNGGAS